MSAARIRWVFVGLIAAGVAVAVAWPEDAAGKDKSSSAKDAKKDDKAQKFDPNNRTAISELMFTVFQGNGRFSAKDYPGALESYKKAVTIAPNDPLGHYLVAEAQLAQGNVAEAEAALAQAEKVGDKRPDVLGKVYFLQADAKERQKKWEEARAAWAKYDGWAQRRGGEGGAFPQTAAARISTIDEMVKLDKAYEDVRQRIAAEKDGGAAPSIPPVKK